MAHTDRIEKQILLTAPLDRVWNAISDARQFGTWFGVEFDGPFAPRTKLTGKISPTKINAEIAKLQEPHAGKAFEFVVDKIEPMQLISFRWHPYAIDPNVDYSREPMTLIEFRLAGIDRKTQLTITESGFENLPSNRREEALKANEEGWTMQTRLIQRYVSSAKFSSTRTN